MLNTALRGKRDLVRITEAAEEIFEGTKVREIQLSHLFVFHILSGLLFMLLPGTFLGVWPGVHQRSLHCGKYLARLDISHGHAQALAWIGTFILGGHWLLFHSQIARRNEAISRFVRVRRIHWG